MSLSTQPIDRRAWLAGSFLPFWPFRSRHQKIAGIRFDILRHGRSAHRYFHVHGNETTARELLYEHMKKHKGTGFTVQSLVRQVPLGAVSIDPNRMFSREGAERNLRRLNADLSETTWCCYAWPVNYGQSGNRTFFTNQGGDLVATERSTYSGTGNGPASDASFKVAGAITGSVAIGAVGADGKTWKQVN